MLGFEIGQRESGFYSERTESQTESCQHPVPYYNIDRLNLFLIHRMRAKNAPINVNLYNNTVLDGTSVCDSVRSL